MCKNWSASRRERAIILKFTRLVLVREDAVADVVTRITGTEKLVEGTIDK